jgi:hypothetical protein
VLGTNNGGKPMIATDDVGGAQQMLVDVRVRSLLMAEARRRAVTRMFGVPGDEQSFLGTAILLGAAATVVAGLAARPFPHPSGADLAIGGGVVNAGLGAFAGPASAAMPVAGALIALAVVSHSVRPAVVASLHGIRGLEHALAAVLGVRHRAGFVRSG